MSLPDAIEGNKIMGLTITAKTVEAIAPGVYTFNCGTAPMDDRTDNGHTSVAGGRDIPWRHSRRRGWRHAGVQGPLRAHCRSFAQRDRP